MVTLATLAMLNADKHIQKGDLQTLTKYEVLTCSGYEVGTRTVDIDPYLRIILSV